MNAPQTYQRLFTRPDYARHPDNEFRYRFALNQLNLAIRTVLDVGAGRGSFARQAMDSGFQVETLDCGTFHQLPCKHHVQDLCENPVIPGSYDALVALDVLEHFPEEKVPSILAGFAASSCRLWATIANHSDRAFGEELHLTQRNCHWWGERLHEAGYHFGEPVKAYSGRLYAFTCYRS